MSKQEVQWEKFILGDNWDFDTNTQIVCIAILIQLVLFVAIEFRIQLVQSVVGFIFVAILPGLLTIGTLGLDIDEWEVIPYIIATSLSEMMLLGGVASVLTFNTQLPKPFTSEGFILWIGGGVMVLTAVFRLSRNNPQLPSHQDVSKIINKIVAIHFLFLINVIMGAWILNVADTNLVLIIAITAIATSPILIFIGDPNRDSQLVSVWLVSLALLLQNTLININLQAGDGRFERSLGAVSLIRGYYDPTMLSVRATSLRLTVLNPIFSVATGTDLSIAATVFHPLTLSVIVIAVFLLIERHYTTQIAFISILLVLFSTPWLNTMSRNTRSATAMLFVAVATLSLFSRDDGSRSHYVIFTIAAFAIPATHYGIAPMFLIIIGVAFVFRMLIQDESPGNQQNPFSLTHIATVSSIVVAWFLFTARGTGFEFMVSSIYKTVVSIIASDGASSQASMGATLPMPSFTFQFVKYEYIVTLGIAAVGMAFAFFSLPRVKKIMPMPNVVSKSGASLLPSGLDYYCLAAGASFIVPLAFLPKVGLGIPRIFVFSMLFLAPISILVIRMILKRGGVPTTPVISVVLAFLLVVNSGVFAAAVTHDNSPQPYLDRPYRINEGGDNVIYELYRVYRTDRGWSSSNWLYSYAKGGQVYGSGVQPPIRTDVMTGRTPLEHPVPLMISNSSMCDGYVRLTPGDYQIEETVLTHHPDFVYYGNQSMPLSEVPIGFRNKVFAAGETAIYSECD